MRVAAQLSAVEVRVCAKPGCGVGAPLDRHHKRHEAMWLGVWAFRHREPAWRAFVKRYYEFRKTDTVDLCRRHHTEVHAEYDKIIAHDLAKVGRPLSKYSWPQARHLMAKLEEYCLEWLQRPTPGMDSEVYDDIKRLRRRVLKKRATKKRRHDG